MRIERVMIYYIPLVLVPVGLCSNLLSLLVLGLDKTMIRTTKFLLQMLSLADSLFLLIYPMYGLMAYHGLLSTVCRRAIASACSTCLRPIVHMAAVWMVVIVTVERYIAISWSLHAARHITMTRVRIAVGVVWISSIVFSLPYCMEFKIQLDDEYTCTNDWSGLIDYYVLYRVYHPYIKPILVFALPLTLLIVFNSLLVKAIRRSTNRTRQIMTSRVVTEGHHISSNEQRVTYMTIGVVIVFIVCQLPKAISGIYDTINLGKASRFTLLVQSQLVIFLSICSPLLVLNSVVNFFIYFLLGSRFRTILVNCMRCRQRDRPYNTRA